MMVAMGPIVTTASLSERRNHDLFDLSKGSSAITSSFKAELGTPNPKKFISPGPRQKSGTRAIQRPTQSIAGGWHSQLQDQHGLHKEIAASRASSSPAKEGGKQQKQKWCNQARRGTNEGFVDKVDGSSFKRGSQSSSKRAQPSLKKILF
jgi:hypothetical protein